MASNHETTVDHPLFASEEEARRAPGRIFKHFKGGIYRVLQTGVQHTERDEMLVFYEHLWPHTHGYYCRPEKIFFGKTDDGKIRFQRIQQDQN